MPAATAARAFAKDVTVTLRATRRRDTTARSRVRSMDMTSLWVAAPDVAWAPASGETLTLETQHANVRYEAQTRFLDAATDPEPLWRLAHPPDDAITRSPGRADLHRPVWAFGSVFVYADVEPLHRGPQVPVAVIALGAGGARLEAKT